LILQSIVLGCATIALATCTVTVGTSIASAVSERAAEIAIRKAIGARTRDILQHFVAEVLIEAGLGVLLGTVGAFLIALEQDSVMSQLGIAGLFEPTPSIVLGAAVLVSVVCAVAGYIPASRAARTSPAVALRLGAM
jgi:putative ABC transport system permease protein